METHSSTIVATAATTVAEIEKFLSEIENLSDSRDSSDSVFC